MQNNYYFLRQISTRLHEQLTGFTLVSCFSQAKDEIVFEFNNSKRSFFIRADLQGDFTCLTFPETFHRARKNSIDLFNEILMKKVTGARQFLNERSFEILLEDDFGILFKMHGNKSNIVLLNNNEEIDRFKNNIPGGISADREIDWSKEAFEKNIDHPERLYFTFGKGLIKKDWDYIQHLKKQLEEPKYYVTRQGFSLVPVDPSEVFTDPFKAANEFYSLYVSSVSFDKQKTSLVSQLNKEIAQTKSWLQKTSSKLQELQQDDHYKSWGDLLMANLHEINTGAKNVTLQNFYDDNKPIGIPLDQNLSPQKNAERYYRKGKNQQIEITKLKEGLASKMKELEKIESELIKVENLNDLKSLKSVAITNPKPQTVSTLPYRQFEFKGFTILVGKDAKANDELTTKWASKNDLWLHARDVSGSHVVIRHKAGQPFPKDVIEYAAGIAAYNSKRKTESLVPVIVTPRKFVRKRKGDPAGAVVVEREDVILVEPTSPAPKL